MTRAPFRTGAGCSRSSPPSPRPRYSPALVSSHMRRNANTVFYADIGVEAVTTHAAWERPR